MLAERRSLGRSPNSVLGAPAPTAPPTGLRERGPGPLRRLEPLPVRGPRRRGETKNTAPNSPTANATSPSSLQGPVRFPISRAIRSRASASAGIPARARASASAQRHLEAELVLRAHAGLVDRVAPPPQLPRRLAEGEQRRICRGSRQRPSGGAVGAVDVTAAMKWRAISAGLAVAPRRWHASSSDPIAKCSTVPRSVPTDTARVSLLRAGVALSEQELAGRNVSH